MLPRIKVEWLAVLLLGGLVLLCTQLPAIWGWRAQRLAHYPDHVFTGSLHTYADDATTYWAWMDQANEGRVGMTDRYTVEPHPRTYVNVLFLLMGSIGRLGGWSENAVYTVARPVFGAILFFLLYLLSARLFELPGHRFVCFVFLVLAGGWEGYAEMLKTFGGGHLSSPQWWTPEMNTVFSLLLFPHFLAGFICMVGALLLMLSAWSEEPRSPGARVRYAVGAGAVLFVLTFFHPYDVVVPVGVVGCAPFLFALLRPGTLRRDLRLSVVTLSTWLPALLYNYLLFRRNPAMRAWDLQNLMWTPDALGLVIGFGVALPAALLSLLAIRRMGRPLLLLYVWLAVVLVAIHLPVRFQRRMIGGVQFPLGGLTAAALCLVVLPFLARTLRRLGRRSPLPRGMGAGAAVAVLFLLPLQVATPFYVCRAEWNRLRRVEYPAWLPAALHRALGFLAGAPGPESVVLASYKTGNYVPPYTGKRCVLGHYALTIDARKRESEIADFFSEEAANDDWRLERLRQWGVRYLIVGPYERELGAFDPATRPWLELLHVEGAGTGDETAVFEVAKPG